MGETMAQLHTRVATLPPTQHTTLLPQSTRPLRTTPSKLGTTLHKLVIPAISFAFIVIVFFLHFDKLIFINRLIMYFNFSFLKFTQNKIVNCQNNYIKFYS